MWTSDDWPVSLTLATTSFSKSNISAIGRRRSWPRSTGLQTRQTLRTTARWRPRRSLSAAQISPVSRPWSGTGKRTEGRRTRAEEGCQLNRDEFELSRDPLACPYSFCEYHHQSLSTGSPTSGPLPPLILFLFLLPIALSFLLIFSTTRPLI